MMYQVSYLRQKKKNLSKQIAGDFLTIDDAEFWAKIVESQGAKDIKILVK
jgi:hypothetical protein